MRQGNLEQTKTCYHTPTPDVDFFQPLKVEEHFWTAERQWLDSAGRMGFSYFVNSQLALAMIKEARNLQAHVDPRSNSLANVPSSSIFCAFMSGHHSSDLGAHQASGVSFTNLDE
jgi:hypothetical protein